MDPPPVPKRQKLESDLENIKQELVDLKGAFCAFPAHDNPEDRKLGFWLLGVERVVKTFAPGKTILEPPAVLDESKGMCSYSFATTTDLDKT